MKHAPTAKEDITMTDGYCICEQSLVRPARDCGIKAHRNAANAALGNLLDEIAAAPEPQRRGSRAAQSDLTSPRPAPRLPDKVRLWDKCPICDKAISMTQGGRLHKHGPRGAPCPGVVGSTPPRSPWPSEEEFEALLARSSLGTPESLAYQAMAEEIVPVRIYGQVADGPMHLLGEINAWRHATDSEQVTTQLQELLIELAAEFGKD
jgi:hypothetical protein